VEVVYLVAVYTIGSVLQV